MILALAWSSLQILPDWRTDVSPESAVTNPSLAHPLEISLFSSVEFTLIQSSILLPLSWRTASYSSLVSILVTRKSLRSCSQISRSFVFVPFAFSFNLSLRRLCIGTKAGFIIFGVNPFQKLFQSSMRNYLIPGLTSRPWWMLSCR